MVKCPTSKGYLEAISWNKPNLTGASDNLGSRCALFFQVSVVTNVFLYVKDITLNDRCTYLIRNNRYNPFFKQEDKL